MKPVHPVTEDELHAYVDGRLGDVRRSEVQDYLDAHPESAQRVQAYARDRAALREALAPLAEAPIPPELNLANLTARPRRPAFPQALMAASVAAAVLVGAVGGWSARTVLSPPQAGVAALGREAAYSYRVYASDKVRPVEVSVGDQAVLTRWLSKRLNRTVEPPDLSHAGYTLLGGRLVATPQGPAGLFLYDAGSGTRIGVFVRPMQIETNEHMRDHRFEGLDGVVWSDDGLGYGVFGPPSAEARRSLADEVRRQAQSLRSGV